MWKQIHDNEHENVQVHEITVPGHHCSQGIGCLVKVQTKDPPAVALTYVPGIKASDLERSVR